MIYENVYNETFELLKKLISIPSPSNNEKDIVIFISDLLKSMNIDSKLHYISTNSANLTAEIKSKFKGPTIILAGHVDTVPIIDGWTYHPLNPSEIEDRIYGLGSSDMKAGIAIAIKIFQIFNNMKEKLRGTLKLLFVADEEGYSTGIKSIIQEGEVGGDAVFMIEPEYQPAIIGAVGKILIKIKARGKAAHAALPEQGINAIEETSKFISNLGTIPKIKDSILPYQPYIVFNIKGGYEKYSVTLPDYCEATVNKHTVESESKEYILSELYSLEKQLDLKSNFAFEIIQPFYPSYIIEENFKYLNILKESYKTFTGNELKTAYGTGVSDANCLVGIANIPTINFGPSGGSIHSPDEWVSKKQIINVINIYYDVLKKCLL
ncbi:MAG TPA: M20 family metallopeptidase [Thermoanaerobacter sp.]|nr:M20 family metallopeptidase [Thermoanaerobacter sp.]